MPTATCTPSDVSITADGVSWSGGSSALGVFTPVAGPGSQFGAVHINSVTVPSGVAGFITGVTVNITHSGDDGGPGGEFILQSGAPGNWNLITYPVGYEVPFTISDTALIPELVGFAIATGEFATGFFGEMGAFIGTLGSYEISDLTFSIDWSPGLDIDPAQGPIAGGTAVTITGTDFVADSTVAFDGLPATSIVIVNDTTITCVTPANAEGTVSFAVTAPDLSPLGSGTFTYVELTFDPPIGTTFGGTIVEITGVTIPADSTATLDGIPITLIFNGGTVTFETPGHSPTEVDIVVTFPDAQVYSGTFHFYVFPSFTPPGGPPAGGTLVAIHRWYFEADDGTEFIPGATITFDGTPATDITFIDVDNYTCKTPAHAAGFVDVVISNISSLGLVMEYPNEFAYSLTLKAPFINAGPDKVARGPAPSTVAVAATSDAVSATFLWEQTGGPQAVTISSPTSLTTNLIFPTYVPGVYTFRIKALLADLPYISDSMNVKIPVLYPPKIVITGTS